MVQVQHRGKSKGRPTGGKVVHSRVGPNAKAAGDPLASISGLIGRVAVLPGESEEEYRLGLLGALKEFGATTQMQVYVAERIYECLCWMGRYERQKRATLIRAMAVLIDSDNQSGQVSSKMAEAMEALFANRVDDRLRELLDDQNLTMESLTQRAFARTKDTVGYLDSLTAIQAKTLVGLQASYEVLVNRGVNAERMRLQNELMRRDLGAIEHEQPKKAPLK